MSMEGPGQRTSRRILFEQAAVAAATIGVGVGPAIAVRPPEFVNSQPGFTRQPSGLQIKEVKVGEGTSAAVGDRVVYTWEGYTIGYFGRPFKQQNGPQGGDFQGGSDADRFVVGRGDVVPALDEGVQGMRVGGIRQLVFAPELGYPFIGDEKEGKLVDPNHDKVGPKPTSFSGMRALNFVLENKGDQLDKTLLINVKIVRIDKAGTKQF